MGAVLPSRVRRRAVGCGLGSGGRAWPGRVWLSRDRCPPAREGLPRLGFGYHARRQPGRGRPRLCGQGRQAGRVHRPRCRGRCSATRDRAAPGLLVLSDPRAVTLGSEPVRIGDEVVGRVTTGGFGFAVDRSIALLTCPWHRPRSEPRSRSRCSATGSRPRWRRSRCGIRRVSGSELRRSGMNNGAWHRYSLGGAEELAHRDRLVTALADAHDCDRHPHLLLDEP